MEWLENLQLQKGYLIQPLLVGTLVSIVCSLVGCFIVLRRMAFLADAISHSMLAGVIGGYLTMKILFKEDTPVAAMLFGALLAGIITVAAIGFVTRFSRVKEDTAIGIMYTGLFALGAFVISLKSMKQYIHLDIYHFIVGNVVSVTSQELWLLGVVTSIVVGIVVLFYRPLQLTSFDPVMAASIGVPVMAVDYMLTACTSLVVVSGVRIAGIILVVALIITPAATAYLLFDRLNRMLWGSAIIGVFGFWLGFWISTWVGASAGATIVVTSTLIFFVVLTFSPRYGLLADWIRRANSVPQEVMEDVLGCITRYKDSARVPMSHVIKSITNPNMQIRRAIRSLARQDLLNLQNDTIELTDNGRHEAKRLLRAHRLWETYLQRAGAEDAEIHERAHVLEHISDQATVEYLDDKLGHPLTDPHGSEIPEDESYLKQNTEVLFSMLREGRQAKITRVTIKSEELGLTLGELVTVGPRIQNDQVWTLIRGDGSKVQLNHDQADSVVVARPENYTEQNNLKSR